MRRSAVSIFSRLTLRPQQPALCLFSNGAQTAVSEMSIPFFLSLRNYAKDKGGKGGPPPSARPLPTGPAEPPKLEEVETPDFGEDKPFTADISDFPDPKEWKKVSNWEEFQFSPKVKKIAEAMFQLNQVETFELLKLLQLRFDVPDSALMGGGVVVQAAAPGTPAPAGATPGGDAPSAQAQSEAKAEKMIFDVQLVAVNEADKFKVLKEIRTMKPGMKLLESKEMVEKLPSMLKQNVQKDEAEKLAAKFKELGGTVELK